MIAFWSYDLYPYLLSGKVEKYKDDLVYIKSYSSWFRPKFLLPDTEGELLAEKLEQLRGERDEASRRIDKGFDEQLTLLLSNVTKRR